MRFTRDTAIKINNILDTYIPPILRDSKVVNDIIFRLVFGDEANLFLEFKEKASKLTPKQYDDVYERAVKHSVKRVTDLNSQCLNRIKHNIVGKNVLEVGCGKCYLTGILSKKYKVTAIDIAIDKKYIKTYPKVKFIKSRVESLKVKSKQYDTVICTHTLEHILDINKAIKELRRVCKKRLIIVVPKQRPYKYTFDLHLNFFPYIFMFTDLMGNKKNSKCEEVGGDIFYIEDLE